MEGQLVYVGRTALPRMLYAGRPAASPGRRGLRAPDLFTNKLHTSEKCCFQWLFIKCKISLAQIKNQKPPYILNITGWKKKKKKKKHSWNRITINLESHLEDSYSTRLGRGLSQKLHSWSLKSHINTLPLRTFFSPLNTFRFWNVTFQRWGTKTLDSRISFI